MAQKRVKPKKKRGNLHRLTGNSFLRVAAGILAREEENITTLKLVAQELHKEGLRVRKMR